MSEVAEWVRFSSATVEVTEQSLEAALAARLCRLHGLRRNGVHGVSSLQLGLHNLLLSEASSATCHADVKHHLGKNSSVAI